MKYIDKEKAFTLRKVLELRSHGSIYTLQKLMDHRNFEDVRAIFKVLECCLLQINENDEDLLKFLLDN